MAWKVIGAVTAGVAIAFAASAMMPQSNPDEAIQASCIAKGGTFRSFNVGSRVRSVCEQPFADAGKICSSKADCQGACTLPDDFVRVIGRKLPTTGTCQAHTKLGCMTLLEDGVPTHFCAD